MSTELREIVLSDGNRDAFEAIINITRDHEHSQNIFIYGPEGSGKTAAVAARCFNHDLLSPRRAISTTPSELVFSLTTLYDYSQNFLNDLGEMDVLFIDQLDDAYLDENKEIGFQAFQALISARMQDMTKVRDNVIIARKPKSEYAGTPLGSILKTFKEYSVEELDEAGKIEVLHRIEERNNLGQAQTRLFSDDAIEFLLSDEIGDMVHACRIAESLFKVDETAGVETITKDLIIEILKARIAAEQSAAEE